MMFLADCNVGEAQSADQQMAEPSTSPASLQRSAQSCASEMRQETEKSNKIIPCAYSDFNDSILPLLSKEQRWQNRVESITTYWNDRKIELIKAEQKNKIDQQNIAQTVEKQCTVPRDGKIRTVDENFDVIYGEG